VPINPTEATIKCHFLVSFVVTRAGFRVAIGGTRTIRDRIGVATHLPRSRKIGIWDIMAVTVRGEGVRGGDGERPTAR